MGCGSLSGQRSSYLIWSLKSDNWHLDFFLQKEKANDGESVISFETHKKKVISIYSYNLDYDLY